MSREGAEKPALAGFVPGRHALDAYGKGGFRFAGMSHRGSVLVLPTGIQAWPVAGMADLTFEAFAPVLALAGSIDFMLVGTGEDPAHLPEALRRRCAEVLRDTLAAPGLDLDALTEVLLEAIRFEPFPDAVPALVELRAAGVRLVAASNWDVSLHEQLERTGLRPLLDGAVSSAEAGAAKPDPEILLRALEIAGAAPGDAWHVGDDLEADVGGARAAGIDAVLVDRSGGGAPGVRSVQSLAALQVP